jgi:glutaredoxin/predicted RNA-binding Zn-ribbon protein involved in translation (DUF1610 family)
MNPSPISCPKCGHRREPAATAPAWQCPACGVAYAKVEQAREEVQGTRDAAGHGMAAQATANASAGRRGAVAVAPSFFTTLPGRMLLVTVIALLFFAGKAWLHGARGSAGSAPGAVAGVEIYTTSYCDTCKIAKAYMSRYGIAYTEYDVEADIGRRREFYERGGRGTPLIFVRGQRMEGFDVSEFEKLRRGRS